jgi:hypothetical protein
MLGSCLINAAILNAVGCARRGPTVGANVGSEKVDVVVFVKAKSDYLYLSQSAPSSYSLKLRVKIVNDSESETHNEIHCGMLCGYHRFITCGEHHV